MSTDDNALGKNLGTSVVEARLQIKHLLVWTALCGVWLAWFRWADFGKPDSFGRGNPVFWRVYAILQCLSGGAALGVLPLWWARRAPPWRFPLHPGEWLWVVRGLQYLISFGMATAFALMGTRFILESGSITRHGLVEGVAWILILALDLVGLFHVRQSRRWLVFMALQTFVHASQFSVAVWWTYFIWEYGSPPNWLLGLEQGIWLVPVIVVLCVAFLDWRSRIPFPWTHWTGIAIVAWEAPVHFWLLIAF